MEDPASQEVQSVNAADPWMMMVFLFDFGEVPEALEVLVANKEDEIHLAVDQKQPHAERVLQFIFLHINTKTLWDTRVLWTGTVEIHVCSKSKNSMVLISTDISVAPRT